MVCDGDFDDMKKQLHALRLRVDDLERRVVRKDHLLRIIRDTAGDEVEDENGDV